MMEKRKEKKLRKSWAAMAAICRGLGVGDTRPDWVRKLVVAETGKFRAGVGVIM